MSEDGEIYVLVNQAMPGLVKVGKTQGGSTLRAKKLSGATGVPESFQVVRVYNVFNVDEAEKFAHTVLERTNGRPNSQREFFFGPESKVVEILNQALARFLRPTYELPEGWRLGLEKALNNQPRIAFFEFNFAIQQGQCPSDQTIPLSGRVIEALAAYGACCCFVSQKPAVPHLFANLRSKHTITERMIEFLILFQVNDPQICAINFMRQAA